MMTIYDSVISDKNTLGYLNHLINKIFALLPMYEDSETSIKIKQSFKIYQDTLIQTINGYFNLIEYNDNSIVDVLSHLESLKYVDNHADYKRHILKVCNLLSLLKEGVEKDGL